MAERQMVLIAVRAALFEAGVECYVKLHRRRLPLNDDQHCS